MSHERAASGRILIVDDEPELVEGFRSVLEGAGFEATIQTSLITLPLTIRKLNPDLILVDLSMPGLSAPAFFAQGAHRLLRTKAPIILFSGRDSRELSRITEEVGADGFLCKAHDLEDSVRRIRLWVSQRRAIQTAGTAEERRDESRPASPAAQ